MFSNVITGVQTLLSRSFLLASYFPVLIFAMANVLIAYFAYPSIAHLIPDNWNSNSGSAITVTSAFFVGVGILAYVISPLTDPFSEVMAGNLLPKYLRRQFLWEYANSAWKKREELQKAKVACNYFFQLVQTGLPKLQTARAAGNQPGVQPQPKLISAAQGTVSKLRYPIDASDIAETKLFDSSFDALEFALKVNPTNVGSEESLNLQSLHATLRDYALQGERLTKRLLSDSLASEYTTLDSMNPQPTRFGNVRTAVQNYSRLAYKVEFDFLWPRLRLLVASKDEKLASSLDFAKAQLDFAVLALLLTVSLPAIWLPTLAFSGSSLKLFLLIGGVAPLVSAFFYGLVEQSQRAFGEIINSAIDEWHLDLLKALYQERPVDLKSERETWHALQTAVQSDGLLSLSYRKEA